MLWRLGRAGCVHRPASRIDGQWPSLFFLGRDRSAGSLAGTGILVYLVILRVTHRTFLSNRPILFLGVLLIILGIQFVSIGLLGEMIARSAVKRSASVRGTLGL